MTQITTIVATGTPQTLYVLDNTDPSNLVLVGAATIVAAPSGVVDIVETTTGGEFKITAAGNGSGNVEVSAPGYAPLTVPATAALSTLGLYTTPTG